MQQHVLSIHLSNSSYYFVISGNVDLMFLSLALANHNMSGKLRGLSKRALKNKDVLLTKKKKPTKFSILGLVGLRQVYIQYSDK